MLAPARSGARFFAENQGQNRETGVERTSATASTPAARSIAIKRSAAILEWPMVKRSKVVMVQFASKLRIPSDVIARSTGDEAIRTLSMLPVIALQSLHVT